jgi:2-phospho-L-lactate/phosphoenolpyruvate guanylyltransferase
MNPDLWAVIPVKPFALGKSRLAGVLDAPSRTALNRKLFDHVFNTTVAGLGANRVAVVTSGAELAATIDARGAHGIVSEQDLNAALGYACRMAAARGAQAIVVLPSDLPFVSQDDIAALAAALPPAPGVVVAPDAADQATNALVLSPPDPDFFRFGPSSFAAHLEAARERGATAAIVRRPGLAFDLDTPEDYRAFVRRVSEHAPS